MLQYLIKNNICPIVCDWVFLFDLCQRIFYNILVIKEYNVKDNMPSVIEAIGLIEIEIELCKKEGISLLKVIHGYGSGGVGGNISVALKQQLRYWKKIKLIQDYLFGNEWNGLNAKARNVLFKNPDIPLDRDFNHSNMGMTILIL